MSASIQQMIGGLATLEKCFEIKIADLAIKDVINEYLKHKVTRLEECNSALKEQIKDELSHHARYNAIKADVKDFVSEDNRKKLLSTTRDRAGKLLTGFLKDQEAKYGEFDEKETLITAAHQKKVADMRKKQKAAAAVVTGGGSKITKSPIGKKKGAKGTTADGEPKRKLVAVPRARFISDITPQYNEEKKKAKAAGGTEPFPSLFAYVKQPWDNMDPAEKKRKYEDPFEADKKKRAEEDKAAGKTVKKQKKPVVVEESDGEQTDAEPAAVSDNDDVNGAKSDNDDDNDGNDDDDDDDAVPSASEDEADDGNESD